MKFSESWLREWVDPKVNRAELLEQLTMAGLEVDGSEPVAAEFSGVVVGKVLSADKHPNADKLSVCEVTDGSESVVVVCGAPNVRKGLVTAFARVGALLPGDFKIKKTKLRGVESHGMLCSASELELGDDHDGILELADELTVGADLREALALDDVCVDVDLTPNRGDCLSVKGLAREVGVLNDLAVNYLEIPAVAATVDDAFPVRLADSVGCPRYLGRVIRDVDISRPTPLWMTERLRRSGLRSIDAIVDVTNYVMLELGQPLHAFDLNELKESIVVRKATAGETLTLLDGQQMTLDCETLLITDAAGPIAMAGVMGGDRSGVQRDTRDVFLECAFFAPLAVAGVARRYGLHTDASHRYERGVDFELQQPAIERATALLLAIVGGEAGPVVETADRKTLPKAVTVRLRQRRLNQLVGADIPAAEIDTALERLDFPLVERTESGEDGVVWQVRSPSHRFDIALEADLVEEVCRIYGYNNIASRRPVTALELRRVAADRAPDIALKQQLGDLGYQEVITYSFVDPALQDLLDPSAAPLALANPMSSEQSVMRTNMLPGLLDVLVSNVSRQQDRARLFELGLTFKPGEHLEQNLTLGGVLWGLRFPETWHGREARVDFYDLKGDVERFLAWTGMVASQFEPLQNDPVLHPGQAAALRLDDRLVGRLGRLHPEIERRLGVTEVFVFEFSGSILLEHAPRRHLGVSKYPSVRRDLAIVVSADIPASLVESLVRVAIGPVLVDFRLFDVYHGKGIDSTEKSLALGLTLQDASATLNEEQISAHVERALAALHSGAGARLR